MCLSVPIGGYEVDEGICENAFHWKTLGQELRVNDVTVDSTSFQHGNRALASKDMRKSQGRCQARSLRAPAAAGSLRALVHLSPSLWPLTDRSLPHSDESRLANLLRRVSREDDRDRRLATMKQLKDFIQHSENKAVSYAPIPAPF